MVAPIPLAVLGGQAIDIRFIEISETMVHDFFDASKSYRGWQGGIQRNYGYYKERMFDPYPSAASVGYSHAAETIRNYEEARRELFIRHGWEVVDPSGKIHDDVFMALILASEIGYLKYDTAVYAEAVEALSNQYYGETKTDSGAMQCFGGCFLIEQLRWATQMEAIYAGDDFAASFAASGAWREHIHGAHDAIARYQNGADTSWFWGNVDREHLSCYEIVIKRETNTYPGRPYFIIYEFQYYSCAS